MKLYLKIITSALFIIVWLGFIGPACISGTTELAIGWILFTVLIIPLFIFHFIGKKKKVS
jgi:hypothetical protein